MENNFSSENKVPGELTHHQNPTMQEVFPDDHENDSMTDNNIVGKGNNSSSDEEDQSFTEEEMNDLIDPNQGMKFPFWPRVKWTDSMVKLLILAVSYICEVCVSKGDLGTRRQSLNSPKKGKWRSVSKVMTERGFIVSPQQCEDKFNNLNTKYKRLNEILGKGTTCKVVERPALLDKMDHLSDKMKDEVRKILSSKQLFYEEMCSYHNGNRLHLPHDPELQRSLLLAHRSKDDNDSDLMKRSLDDVVDDDDDDEETYDDDEEYEDDYGWGDFGDFGNLAKPKKRMKQGQDLYNFSFEIPQTTLDFNSNSPLELEEQKIKFEQDKLELEKQRLKWERFHNKENRKLEKLKMENLKMRIENQRLVIELKQIEMAMKRSLSDN